MAWRACSSCENHAPHFYGNVKLGLHVSMETGPATQSPVAEVEPSPTSAFRSQRPPAAPGDSPATSRGAVAGRWSLRFWDCESALIG